MVAVNGEKAPITACTARRGFDTVISAFGADNMDIACEVCKACVEICPVGALVVREDGKEK